MPISVRVSVASVAATLASAFTGGCQSAPGVQPTPTPAATPTPTPKPNVLLIVVDDLATRVGSYGWPVLTPRIDALASRGLRLSRAYCAYPLCNPSRSSFLTGLRVDRVSSSSEYFRTVPAAATILTLPQHFRANGYYTAGIGKVFHDGAGMDNSREWESYRQDFSATAVGLAGEGEDLTRGYLPCCRWQITEGGDDDQRDGQIAAAAIHALENRPAARPFFLGVGFHKPHEPFAAPKPYYDRYPLQTVAPMSWSSSDRDDIPSVALPAEFPFSRADARRLTQAYHASVTFTDTQVGRLLDALDRLGLTSTTVVVLLGDNGHHLGEHGHFSKNTLFSPSVRVPLIWAGPGIAAGRVYDEPMELLDLYPTLAELCGLGVPTHVEGASVASIIRAGAGSSGRVAYLVATPNGSHGHGIATSRWQFHEWGSNGHDGVELYDEQGDPGELTNLASDPAYATVVDDLRQRLRAHW